MFSGNPFHWGCQSWRREGVSPNFLKIVLTGISWWKYFLHALFIIHKGTYGERFIRTEFAFELSQI
jgi:hypothetical protein